MDKLKQLIALYHKGQMSVDLIIPTALDLARFGDKNLGRPEDNIALVLLSLLDRKALANEGEHIVARLEDAIK